MSHAQKLFEASFARADSCWLWQRYIDRDGYGVFSQWGESPQRAHRFAYELYVGTIPEGYEVDHLCRTRACVNPAHLEAVTPHENWRRASSPTRINSLKTRCDHGHPFDAENTYWRPDGTGRHCRACRRDVDRRRASRKAAA